MRRVFRRQIRKTLAPDVPPILQEANFAFVKAEYGRAAELFEKIAQVADARGGPRAYLFHLQAGRSRLLAGQSGLGFPSIKRGLELLAENRLFGRLHYAGERVLADMKENGLTNEAKEIEKWLKSVMPDTPTVDSRIGRPTLPIHCPSCGAPLRPDEVDWFDDSTAECGYCGSPVRTIA